MSFRLRLLLGCSHKHYTFPLTPKAGPRRPAVAGVTGTYVVCLDCAQEIPYDWREMKLITSQSHERLASECSAEVVRPCGLDHVTSPGVT